ncbi:DASH family cryptochrome [Nitzschia inconspicua]|uniref:Cryptochrome DASH n=1 Tax=Nitzschia inconspicua TaxID=303405 RepID=A0A9K3LLT2_9STRA|nr:DASH family cryptochrome [Nitzschia inconspicua]
MSPRTVVGLSSPAATSTRKNGGGLIFYWFRQGDMRLHDNPALDRAAAICSQTQSKLVPVFCFDPRIYGDQARGEFGSIKCGPRRAKFCLESVIDLRESLEKKGSKLLVSTEKPEDLFRKLLQNHDGSRINDRTKLVYQDEVCSEEVAVANKVKKLFQSSEAVWGSTMYELKDLPYQEGLTDMPDTFTPFRNKVEKKSKILPPIPVPKDLGPFPSTDELPAALPYLSNLPTLQDMGYTQDQIDHANLQDPRGVMSFEGGETAALARVKDYIWDKNLLRKYFDTRNGMIGGDYSSKFSPWLAHGNLSPRYVARECQKYEEQIVANKSTYWLVFELLWRDYWKFFALKHGTSLFFPGGTIGSTQRWKHFEKNLQAWIEGRTGFPLVDANMRELAATGFMSNRGRQNVCSFLALELNQDWRYGAEYFESVLLDHDVHSNYGNWCAGAGMTGGRLNRFNIVKQSKDYDQHGDYVRLWLPELKDVPTQFVHEPWKMTQFQQMEYNCRLGVDYPNPITKPFYPDPKSGSKSKGDYNNRRGGEGKHNNSNKNNRHQRKEMKSLKTGSYQISS